MIKDKRMDALHSLDVRQLDLERDFAELSAFLDAADLQRLQQIQGVIRDGDSIVLVAEWNGRAVGWAMVQTRYREDLGWETDADALEFVSGENAYLENLEVEEALRRQGIGRELLAAMMRENKVRCRETFREYRCRSPARSAR